jgi:hypothetical protein
VALLVAGVFVLALAVVIRRRSARLRSSSGPDETLS